MMQSFLLHGTRRFFSSGRLNQPQSVLIAPSQYATAQLTARRRVTLTAATKPNQVIVKQETLGFVRLIVFNQLPAIHRAWSLWDKYPSS